VVVKLAQTNEFHKVVHLGLVTTAVNCRVKTVNCKKNTTNLLSVIYTEKNEVIINKIEISEVIAKGNGLFEQSFIVVYVLFYIVFYI
jgi:hypothetical protein